MANVSLPLSLAASFNSQRGLDQLHQKLDHGLQENETVRAYFAAQAAAYRLLSGELVQSLIDADAGNDKQQGFAFDDGASLKRAFVGGLQASTEAYAGLYRKVATDLERKLVQPYTRWSNEHADRIMDARKSVSVHVQAYRKAHGDVDKAKNTYDSKCVKLEEEEAEMEFHSSPPNSVTVSGLAINTSVDKKAETEKNGDGDDTVNVDLSSPIEQKPARQLGRKVSVVDRLKALAKPGSTSPATIEPVTEENEDQEEKPLPEAPKANPSQNVLEIAGIENGAKEWSAFFSHAADSIPKRDLKIPIIGTYHNVHAGEDVVEWFRDNLPVLNGDYDRAFELARTLSEDLFLLKLVGELGNKFHDSHDAYYQFKPEAFYLGNADGLASHKRTLSADKDHLTRLPGPVSPRMRPSSPEMTSPSITSGNTFLRRSNTIISSISHALQPLPLNVRVEKARQEVTEATQNYKNTVRRVEGLRLMADQHVEGYLHFIQKAETERLHFLKTSLQRFQAIVEPVTPRAMMEAPETAAAQLLIEAVAPENDVQGLCEMYRTTGFYRPQPVTFIDHYAESSDSHFGVDLARWQEIQEHIQPGNSLAVPPVLKEMLDHIQRGYEKLPSAEEKRKIWYLEIPLRVSFQLRQALNDATQDTIPTNLLRQSDLPVVASVVKLYFLELEPLVIPYAQYDELKRMYPTVGSSDHASGSDEAGRVAAIQDLLGRIPAINLVTLEALVKHLSELVKSTQTESGDSNDAYLAKLGLSMGKCIARSPSDSPASLGSVARHFLVDLIRLYDQVLPQAIAQRKQREVARFAPKRKRTALVDVRLSRSGIGSAGQNDAHQLLEDQLHRKDPRSNRASAEEQPENLARSDSSASSATITQTFEDAPSEQVSAENMAQGNGDAQNTASTESQTSETRNSDDKPISSPIAMPASILQPSRQAPAPPHDSPVEDVPFAIPGEGQATASAATSPGLPVEDLPFEVPSEAASGGADLSRSSGLGNSLSRTARVSKGPRALGQERADVSSIPAGRVKSAAQRFSVDYAKNAPQ